MNNIIFYFSGTGNSLHVAKSVSKELENCEIVSMTKQCDLTKQYDSIGFVYPTYFWGLPKRVIEFTESISLKNNKNAYYYSIATHGGNPANTVYQMYDLLWKKHGKKLNNGQKLQMFSNYIINHDIKDNVDGVTKKSNEDLIPIINSIKTKKNNKAGSFTNLFKFVNDSFVKKVSTMDKNYSVNGDCSGCGICKEVCPVKNIEMVNGKPQYSHHCEQCLACMHFCPQKAVNYNDVTQNRRRYTHPEISYKELAEYNNK
jgi:ferredoxin/flavodoxin